MKNNKLPYHLKPGFKVPKDYFGNFEDRLMNAVKNEKGQNDLIDAYAGKSGFAHPEGYFDNFENRILELVEATPDNKVIPIYSIKRLLYAAAVAAVFIGIASTVFFQNSATEYTMESLELSALENYIEEGHFDLNFNELSTFISEEGYSFGDFSTAGISDEAVFNYINENVEDPQLLFE